MTPKRVPELDLLRFIAAAAVVAYHYTFRPRVAGVADSTLFAPLSGVTQFGYLGVDLFFLISGFVILWTAQGRRPRQFVASRLLRLFPTFWAALIVSLAFIAWLAPPVPRPWALLANFTMLPSYAHVAPVSPVYWTLALEIKFYVYIWLLLVAKQLGSVERWLTVWLTAATVCQWYPDSAILRSLVIYPFGPLFISGCLLFLVFQSGWTRGRALRVVWALLLACAAAAHNAPDFIPGASRLDQLVAASVVVVCSALMAAVASRRLRIGAPALLLWLGSLTYPLYLIHERVGRLVWSATEGRLSVATRLILIVVLSGLFAWLIAEIVEGRFVSRLKRTAVRGRQTMDLGLEARGNATSIVYERGGPGLVQDPWTKGGQYFGSCALTHRFRPDRPQANAREPLLFVLPIVPWPIRRNGMSVRFGPVIDYLAQRYEVDVLVLADPDEPLPSGPSLGTCHALTFMRAPITSLPRWLRLIKAAWYGLWPWSPPLGATRYARGRLERALLGYLAQKDYAVVVWAREHLDIASRVRRRHPQTRFIMDLVDSPALYRFRQALANRTTRMLIRYEGRKFCRLEKRVREAFDATIYISNVDAQVVRTRADARVHVVPNGIFHADASPLAGAVSPGKVVGFLGNMSYPPNISAALRLAQRVFPRILTRLTDATLLIIGRDPAPEIRQLAGPAISVTGTVDNVWPQIVRTNVFVFPMIEGTGLQNKILEAMYAGVPVVTTPIAAAGMGASSGEQLLVADTDNEIADQALRLLCDPAFSTELAERARAFVLREFSWSTILPKYEAIVLSRERQSSGEAGYGALQDAAWGASAPQSL